MNDKVKKKILVTYKTRKEKVMNKDIDYDALRNDLEDYYGTAMFGGAGMAMGGLSDVESASDDRLI